MLPAQVLAPLSVPAEPDVGDEQGQPGVDVALVDCGGVADRQLLDVQAVLDPGDPRGKSVVHHHEPAGEHQGLAGQVGEVVGGERHYCPADVGLGVSDPAERHPGLHPGEALGMGLAEVLGGRRQGVRDDHVDPDAEPSPLPGRHPRESADRLLRHRVGAERHVALDGGARPEVHDRSAAAGLEVR